MYAVTFGFPLLFQSLAEIFFVTLYLHLILTCLPACPGLPACQLAFLGMLWPLCGYYQPFQQSTPLRISCALWLADLNKP